MAAANGNGGTRAAGPRCIALVGPFQSGKTTLLEAILARTGAIQRQGTVDAGTSVGDASKEARHHKMSVELAVATTEFMGDSYTFIDCPGSVEFIHDMRAALPAVDAAVVVCEADEKKVPQLQLILRELEDLNIPRFLFLNKIDKAETKVLETLPLLQPASRKPLVLRQIPIWQKDIVTGFVDLALERAHVYKEHAPSEVVPLEGESLDRSKEARFSMLEKLADHDDALMEQLLEDIPPPRDKVFDDLAKELRDGLVVPVLMGVASRTNGVLRLLKAARDGYLDDRCPQLSAGIAYYTLFALFPLTILSVAAFGLVVGAGTARTELIDFLLDNVPLQPDSGRRELERVARLDREPRLTERLHTAVLGKLRQPEVMPVGIRSRE